ncbi:MAG TPA: hypothetical protein VFT57_13040 [Gemmatimonadaceae bacterium]|nr:hypothetical protein [Gemmatimonadaceae bacterium]
MNDPLGRLAVRRKTGTEPFHVAGRSCDFTLLDFWRWSASDLLSNAMRGVLAEYIVAKALGADDGARTEWDSCDLRTPDGLRIEVKCAAYLQSWAQTKVSSPSFNIASRLAWDAATNTYAQEPCRSADLYVFALLHHRDKATVDPLDLSQWTFYALPAAVLNERCPRQKTIRLAPLLKLDPIHTDHAGLYATVEQMARTSDRQPAIE